MPSLEVERPRRMLPNSAELLCRDWHKKAGMVSLLRRHEATHDVVVVDAQGLVARSRLALHPLHLRVHYYTHLVSDLSAPGGGRNQPLESNSNELAGLQVKVVV